MQAIQIGRLLRSGTAGFVVGCRVNQLDAPHFGAMVRASLAPDYQVFGLIYDIHIEDDGLVRQLITAQDVPEEVLQDNRENRNVPVELAVLALGYQEEEQVFHLLPPRPPLSLDAIYLCTPQEIVHFTSAGRFGYLRHVLRVADKPLEELLAAHLMSARRAHLEEGNREWYEKALQELIILMRDDYQALNRVLRAVSDIG